MRMHPGVLYVVYVIAFSRRILLALAFAFLIVVMQKDQRLVQIEHMPLLRKEQKFVQGRK